MIIKNIPKLIMSIYNIYIYYGYIETNVCTNGRKRHFQVHQAARNQEYLLRLFMKNRTKTWIYNLHCQKPKYQSRIYQFDKYIEKE